MSVIKASLIAIDSTLSSMFSFLAITLASPSILLSCIRLAFLYVLVILASSSLLYIYIYIYIFEFNVQFISRDHIANVDFKDASVYMEIN